MVKCPGDSHCFLKQNGLHECRCPSEDECPSTGEKVCGSDGITYDNECKLKAAACRSGGGLVLKKEGSCGKYKEIICCVTAVRFILLILPCTLFYGLWNEEITSNTAQQNTLPKHYTKHYKLRKVNFEKLLG